MIFTRDKLLDELQRDEGFRPVVYDDATASPIVSGSLVKGNPTIGYGWNVAGHRLTPGQGRVILGWQVDEFAEAVLKQWPWIAALSDNRQRALFNMAFNLGLAKLSSFKDFLGLMQAGAFEAAATDLEGTIWHDQVGARAQRIEAMIRSG